MNAMNTAESIRKNLTFISRRTPYGSGYAKACLDMVLSAAVFDQHVTLIFMDDGVLQLQYPQAAGCISAKDLGAALSALPLYDVDQIYVEQESLRLRGMSLENLAMEARLCDAQKIAELIRQSDVVFTL
jgi:tRNA 2-thiouridine synthesizing protein C